MKKDFIVSKIEAPQGGSQYVFIGFIDPNEPKSSGGGDESGYPQSPFGKGGEALPFTSPEDIMKNLPKGYVKYVRCRRRNAWKFSYL